MKEKGLGHQQAERTEIDPSNHIHSQNPAGDGENIDDNNNAPMRSPGNGWRRRSSVQNPDTRLAATCVAVTRIINMYRCLPRKGKVAAHRPDTIRYRLIALPCNGSSGPVLSFCPLTSKRGVAQPTLVVPSFPPPIVFIPGLTGDGCSLLSRLKTSLSPSVPGTMDHATQERFCRCYIVPLRR
jgi:hypothetical protein